MVQLTVPVSKLRNEMVFVSVGVITHTGKVLFDLFYYSTK